MANTDLAVRIATILDSTGLNKADKGIQSLEKRAKSLGRTLGVSLGADALVSFGKKAVQAFADDEAAAVKLETAVKNLGLGFASANVTKFISDLESSASVADDQLRPAFQALITTTGSLTQSQNLLNLAIEVSRGSGEDLTTVAQDLANAYVGNTKGLKKYNLGLTQAELKAASFTDVQKKLNDQFQGSNAAYLETTAGKFEAISVAAGNAAESIGGSLVDAIMVVTGSSTIGDLTSGIEKITGYVNGLVESVAYAIFSTKALFNSKYWGSGGIDKIQEDFDKLMAARKLAAANPHNPENNAVTGYAQDRAAQIAAEKAAKARAKALVDATKKNTAELKKQAALKKAGSVFDKEQIGIIAALKGNLSEEERKRLELQLALEQGTVDEAKKLTYELAIAQGLGVKIAQDLASLPAASNPFAAWKGYLDEVELQAKRIAAFTPMTVGGGIPATSGTDFGGNKIGAPVGGGFTPPPSGTYGTQPTQVNFNLDGKTLLSAILDQSLSGNQSYVNRRTGGFE
jgi:hypothetical protein